MVGVKISAGVKSPQYNMRNKFHSRIDDCTMRENNCSMLSALCAKTYMLIEATNSSEAG